MSAQEVIASKLKILSEYYRQLRFYDNLSLDDYKDDWKIQRIVERTLHLAIECCLDIANHIISTEGYREPLDNRDIFAVLGEEKILDKDLSEDLGRMAQFRNIVVHDYMKIDPQIVLDILKTKIIDFETFAKSAEKYLRKIK